MNRIESFAIALVLAVGVPLLLLTLCWFCFIGLWILEGETGESHGSHGSAAVVTVLVMSVLVGIVINIRCLRRWVQGFYQANMKLMTFLYLICSVLTIGLFMGVPIGNIALGILAGLYTGRRNHHAGTEPEAFGRASRRVGLFSGFVVAAVALPIGLLALFAGEEPTVRSLVEAVWIPYSKIAGIGFILALCSLLMLLQYWLARGASILVYRGWKRKPTELVGKISRKM
ncbi:MAG: hypothetical protein CEE38_17230 [Planctomycetes bacterium B3_Pla]|nr:MAG: hypothetical protein CEE38_17230 [Planctomycetes bacterium B3_Pla]